MLKNKQQKKMRPKNHKLRVLLYMLAVEWLFFGSWYMVSRDGVRSIVRMNTECTSLDRQIMLLEADIAHLRQECNEWQHCPFYIERYAREKLSMSYPRDEILLIND